jgi:hypothetical protein
MSRRSGFTLFQLLILIALLAMGFALLLPAIANARLQAARMASANNLKQIGLACHNYHDTFTVLPAGVDARGFSASACLLPFIEQAQVFQSIDFKQAPTDKANAQARATVVKVFLNPLDPVKNVTMDAGATNYLFCAGDKPDLKNNNGMFFAESKLKLSQVPDGLSNTMMAAETLKGDSAVKATTVARQHVELKGDALKGIKPEAGVDDWKDDKNIAADRCAAWMDGKFLQGTFTGTRTVNDERPDVTCAGQGGLSGLRSLSGDTWILMGDGSVHKLSSKVPLKVIQLLANTNDGQPVPDF